MYNEKVKKKVLSTSVEYMVGIDEVGRGPLAGPVTLCACAVRAGFDMAEFSGIKDSKKLSPERREEWFQKIAALKALGHLDFAHVSIPADEIDSIGIAPAIRKALAGCLGALAAFGIAAESTEVLLDGSLKAPEKFALQKTIIKGDEKIPIISAASIVAKVMRDRFMEEQGKIYPAYGFETHRGYGTVAHIKAIKIHGLTPLHRRSFLRNIAQE